ncbi:MAG TPA: hypothetical protein VGI86_07830, partial [Acidimicrobiia bacterium]
MKASRLVPTQERTMADEYDTLILQAYCGELLGDALFGALAPMLDGERRDKVELLQQIEQRTAAMLEPLVDP